MVREPHHEREATAFRSGNCAFPLVLRLSKDERSGSGPFRSGDRIYHGYR